MKIVVKKNELLEALKKIAPICNCKAQPVLNNVLIETLEKSIELTGSNSVTSIKIQVDCEIKESGKALFSANKLAQIVETLKDEIELSESLIESGKTKIKLESENADNYPTELFKTKYDNEIVLSSDILINGIQKTISAADTKNSNAIISGVNVDISNNVINFYATNGNVCAHYYDEIGFDKQINATLSQEVAKEITRIFTPNYELTININDSSIMINDGNTVVKSMLMSGTFPNVSQFLNQKKQNKLTISKEVLNLIIKRCQILRSNTKGELNILKFDISGLTANISFKDLLSEIVIVDKTGDDIKIAFDYELLNIAIKGVNTDDICLQYDEPLKPALIKDKNYSFLICPCQIKDTL